MNKLTFTAAVFAIVLQSCAQQTEKKENKTKDEQKVTYHQAINHSFTINDFLSENFQLEKDVDSIFNTLSNETKVAQLLMPAVGRLGETNDLITQKIKENKIGGVLMLNGTKEEFTNWISMN